jgi:hypothetical protein
MKGMADRDRHMDIEKLLAEVDATLGETPARPQARAGAGKPPAERQGVGLAARVSTATVAAAVAAAVVWVAFFFLPFLGATSGAAGAFLGTFIAVLILRRG